MRLTLHRHAEAGHRGHSGSQPAPPNNRRPSSGVGYHSPVCSSTGDAIDRIAAAIDQLASDIRAAGGAAGRDELIARVAVLWQMVSDLDPELARRARGYQAQADDGPSA